MGFNRAVRLYVAGIATLATLVLAGTVAAGLPKTDWWALFSFFAVGCVLEVSRTHNKAGGIKGSLGFILNLAAGLVLGAFWGALVAGISKAVAEVFDRNAFLKLVFNTSERVISVGLAFVAFRLLGGAIPPPFLQPSQGLTVSFNSALLQVLAFLGAAVVYFAVNSLAVTAVVALASNQPVLKTWRSNTLWVLGYDIVASLLALFVAWVFLQTNSGAGLQRFLFIGIILPLLFARHIYGQLNRLRDLYGELDTAYGQLELNVREQLAMMVKAIEARDPYTSGHSRRVCGLSRAIAIDLGLASEQVEEIENAAILHDVGKIHAEFAPLLQKEGKLTDEEWALMKTHSAKSAELVGLFSRFRGYIVSCVRHHHERWDGRGYPDGIAGDAIPLGARIITIADTIDAMTTNRPYRNALTLDVVFAELIRGKETQFDATLVELTVNSVSVRRLVLNPELVPEYIPSPKLRDRAAEARQRANPSAAPFRTLTKAIGEIR